MYINSEAESISCSNKISCQFLFNLKNIKLSVKMSMMFRSVQTSKFFLSFNYDFIYDFLCVYNEILIIIIKKISFRIFS